MNKWVKIISTLVLGICLIGYQNTASAASIYDDYYHTTSSLEIKNPECSLDITNTWMNYLGSYTDSFRNAVNNGGSWGVSHLPRYQTDGYGNVTHKGVLVYWNESDSMGITWSSALWGPMIANSVTRTVQLNLSSESCNNPTPIVTVGNFGSPFVSAADESVKNFFFNGSVSYPSGYEGGWVMTSGPLIDSDSDGLAVERELAQNTSDNDFDSDDDGINDFIESQWNPDRDDIFCGTQCAYPDPTKKDIYVEVDWMKDSSVDYKPSTTQIGLIQSAFSNKDINLHVDTGQFGGGEELPDYIEALKFEPIENEQDFFNLKNGDGSSDGHFEDSRKGVWRYMITGDKLDDGDDNLTTGAAYGGDDEAFVALGEVRRSYPLTQDAAIAGTMIHEIGHNLCLTNSSSSYTGQAAGCIFSGVDTYASNEYDSAMNYNKQFSLVDYSDGDNETNDHNDWSAISMGMDDFVTLGTDPQEPSMGRKVAFDKKPIYETATAQELKEAAERNQGIEGSNSSAKGNTETPTSREEASDGVKESAASNNERDDQSKQDASSNGRQTTLIAGIVIIVLGAGAVTYAIFSKNKSRR